MGLGLDGLAGVDSPLATFPSMLAGLPEARCIIVKLSSGVHDSSQFRFEIDDSDNGSSNLPVSTFKPKSLDPSAKTHGHTRLNAALHSHGHELQVSNVEVAASFSDFPSDQTVHFDSLSPYSEWSFKNAGTQHETTVLRIPFSIRDQVSVMQTPTPLYLLYLDWPQRGHDSASTLGL